MEPHARDSLPARGARVWATPPGLLALLLILIFLVEGALMVTLPEVPALAGRRWLLAALDSGLLVAVICPAVWALVVRPLRRLAHERGQLLLRVVSAQEAERARLAQELHDGLGQVQTAILLTSRAAGQAQDLDVMRERVGSVHELAAAALDSTRRIARGLSPRVVEDFGLSVALPRLAEELSIPGAPAIAVRDTTAGSRFAPDAELAIYRAIQEAVTNAVRHAGARSVTITLDHAAGRLVFEVSDDGRGPTQASSGAGGGIGLRGMQERLTALRGDLRLSTRAGGGMRVTGQVPAEVLPR